MKTIIYYSELIALFIVCMVGVSFLMAGIEQLFTIRLGRTLMNFGFLVGIGLFVFLKPFLKGVLNKYGFK